MPYMESGEAVVDNDRQQVDWLLTRFMGDVRGVAHAIAVSADGLKMAFSATLDDEHSDQLAAIVSGLVSLSSGAARAMEAGGVEYLTIKMTDGTLVVMPVAGGTSLAALAGCDSDPAAVGHELALMASQIGRAITPAPREPVGR